jgi:V8-like Glu-specific endopeptidase
MPIEPIDNDLLPYVGAVKSFWNGSVVTGATGTLISPRVVLTAGHVVYDPWLRNGPSLKDAFAVRVQVTFGNNITTQSSNVLFTSQRWAEADSRNPVNSLERSLSPYDFGVIVLKQPIDTIVRPAAPPETTPTSALSSMTLNVVGYPTDLKGVPFGQLYGASAMPSQVGDLRVAYPIVTHKGMSGGPVYDLDAASNQITIRAIHTSAPFGDGLGNGLRITSDVREQIAEWLEQNRPV